MSPSKIIRGRRVVTERGCQPAAIHVHGGRIADLTAYDAVPPGSAIVDAGDLVVMPGLVDSHVHVNEPGRTEWEGFSTASRAAAAGGITSLVDMPLNCIPPTTTVENLRQKRTIADAQSFVDVAFWGGVVPDNAGDIEPLLGAGVAGLKCFLIDSGVDEFPAVDPDGLRAALSAMAGSGAPLLVHAELPGPIEEAGKQAESSDPREFQSFVGSRPARAETEAVELVVDMARETGGRAHIVHLSAAEALDAVRRAREDGVTITAETCPHYLSLAAEDVRRGATEFKCAPPIRERRNRDRLWQGLADGTVDMVVSDHSPCTPALKELKMGDFLTAWGGIASLQLSLPVTWTEARARGHEVEALAEWMCAAPARLAGLARKGRIAPGCDADVVFFDPNARWQVDASRLYHRHPLTPYAGHRVSGEVVKTFLRGELVCDRGQVVAEPTGHTLSRAS